MSFRVTVNTDNAAFTDNPAELGDLLREVAEKVDNGRTDGAIMDSNGNKVGTFGFASTKPPAYVHNRNSAGGA